MLRGVLNICQPMIQSRSIHLSGGEPTTSTLGVVVIPPEANGLAIEQIEDHPRRLIVLQEGQQDLTLYGILGMDIEDCEFLDGGSDLFLGSEELAFDLFEGNQGTSVGSARLFFQLLELTPQRLAFQRVFTKRANHRY